MSIRTASDGTPYVTDNGNLIVDVSGWTIRAPGRIESSIGTIVGVVESGLFALRAADVLLLADVDRVETVGRAP